MKNLSSSISSGLQVEVASFIVEDILLSLMRHASKEEVKKLADSPKLATTAEFADWVGQANCVVVLAVVCHTMNVLFRVHVCFHFDVYC